MAKSRARKLADIIVGAGIDIDGNLTFDGGSTSADLTFADNDKANFGDASDLQIYHDGTNSYIKDAGAGELIIQARDAVTIEDGTSGENYIYMQRDNKVALYYDGASKFETTSSGVEVTGTVLSDGLRFGTATDHTIKWGSGAEILGIGSNDQTIHIRLDPSDASNFGYFQITDGSSDKRLLLVDDSGDISFYEDTGTDAKLFWDASAESLGIGTTSPSRPLDVLKSGSGGYIAKFRTSTNALNVYDAGTSANGIGIGTESGQSLRLFTNDTLASGIAIDSSGNVGIGTSSPSSNLDIEGASEVRLDLNCTAGKVFRLRSTTGSKFAVRDSTTGADRLVIDGSGNVGIGTTSPSSELHVYNNGTSSQFRVQNNDGTAKFQKYQDDLYITNDDTGDILFSVSDSETEAMRIDSSGNVGIGATPDAHYTGYSVLNVGASAVVLGNETTSDTNVTMTINNAYLNTGASAWVYKNSDEATRYTQTSGQHRWDTAASGTAGGTITWDEAMRIDTSGNLIVSGTSSGDATSVALHNGGYVHAVSSHQMAGIFDRRDSDGDILIFRKGDTTQVGSIGTGGGDLNIGTGDTRIRFNDATDNLVPLNASNGYRDDAVSLGDSIARFKNLHLSGTAHIGNTKIIPTGSGGNFDMTFQTYSGGYFERVRITGDGNVGIGTTNPEERLTVNGNTVADEFWAPTASGTDVDGSHLIMRGGPPTGNGTSGQVRLFPSPENIDAASSSSVISYSRNITKGLYLKYNETSWNAHPSLFQLSAYLGDDISNANKLGLGGYSTVLTLDGQNTALELIGKVNTSNAEQGQIMFYGSSNENEYAKISAFTYGGEYTSGGLKFEIWDDGTQTELFRLRKDGAVINEGGGDYNFRVESDNNTHALFVQGSSGNVGIGTDNPDARLQVQTTHTSTDVTAANSNSTLNLGNAGAGNGVYNAIKFAGNQQDMYIMSFNNTAQANRRMGFFLGSVAGDATTDETLSITGSGRVGINLATPSYPLHLINPSDTNQMFRVLFPDAYFTEIGTSRMGSGHTQGLFINAQTDIKFGTSGAETMRLTSTGRLGIGTASPTSKLTVNTGASGNTAAFSSGTSTSGDYSGITLHAYSISGVEWYGSEIRSTLTASNPSYNNPRLGFFTQDHDTYLPADRTEKMSILSNGNVGIGTTAPAYKFAVNGGTEAFALTISNTARMTMGADGTWNYIKGKLGQGFRFSTTGAGDDVLVIQNAGNVGIGTDSPYAGTNVTSLTVNAASYPTVALQVNDTNVGQLFGYGSNIALHASGSRYITFHTNDAERMRIDASGNLLIGTTSTADTDVGGKIFSDGRMVQGRSGSGLVDFHDFYRGTAGSLSRVGNIRTNGTSTTYNTSSDQRLKDNIVDAPSASDDIDAIQVRSFNWKANGSHQKYGMVAQELQSVAPEAVSGDADSDDMMGVDYSKLVPMLVKEIQSLRARVAELEGE